MSANRTQKKSDLIVDPACPLTSLDLAAVKSVRTRMRSNGFEPVAVHSPWSLACNPDSAGKAPMGANWQHGQPDFRLFGDDWNWSRAGANTGLLLGRGVTPIQALDFDIDDPSHLAKALEALRGILPKRILIRTRANSSRIAVLVRCGPGTAKCKLQGENGAVERLAGGQQVVVHGTHPTGASLEWGKQRAPWNVSAADLSLMGEGEVEAVFEAIAASGALGGKLDRTSASNSRSGGAGPSGDIARAFSESLKTHGTVVRAVGDLFREAGQPGTYRHDTLVSVAGQLVRRGWSMQPAAELLTSSADHWFGDGSWSGEVESALEHAARRQHTLTRGRGRPAPNQVVGRRK